jgi:hypothetical protein
MIPLGRPRSGLNKEIEQRFRDKPRRIKRYFEDREVDSKSKSMG